MVFDAGVARRDSRTIGVFDGARGFARAWKFWRALHESNPASLLWRMSESKHCFDLTVLPCPLAIARLAADRQLPAWAMLGAFFSVTRTSDELSVVCAADQVPSGVAAEMGWRALKVAGPFALSEIGVLAALAAPLAQAKVSLFAISTFDTDYLLVSEKHLHVAIAALKGAGHRIEESGASF
jgi:uncharacterized protein